MKIKLEGLLPKKSLRKELEDHILNATLYTEDFIRKCVRKELKCYPSKKLRRLQKKLDMWYFI